MTINTIGKINKEEQTRKWNKDDFVYLVIVVSIVVIWGVLFLILNSAA